MANLRIIRIVCAAAIIAGFFMPWVSIWGFSLPGYKIVEIAGGLQQMGKSFGAQADPRDVLVYLPYGIPILALLTILNALAAPPVPRRIDGLGLITGVAPFAGFIYLLSQMGNNVFQILAIGTYWTLLAAGALVVASLQADSSTHKAAPPASSIKVVKDVCPRCAAQNPPASNFCGHCGEPLK